MVAVATYFAYGSNMNESRVRERGLDFTEVGSATMPGYKLAFNKSDKRHAGEGHANIVRSRDDNARVEGVLYWLDSSLEILKMDPYEHAPWNYGREAVWVETEQWGGVWAWTYFANAAVQQSGLLPSREYLDHLLAGQAWLTPEYFSRLASWPVARS